MQRLYSATSIASSIVCSWRPSIATTPIIIQIVLCTFCEDASLSGHKDPSQKCSCIPFPPNTNPPQDHFSSSWSYMSLWDPSCSPTKAYKELCHGLCWSAITLIAGYTSQSAAFNEEPLQLYLTDLGNVCIVIHT